jgi:hypothetical protein
LFTILTEPSGPTHGTVEVISTNEITTTSNLNISSITYNEKTYDVTVISNNCFHLPEQAA